MKKKTNLPTVEDYRKWIQQALQEKSYSHKPHLQKLPYDHNTNDIDKLQERLDAINTEINNTNQKIKELKIKQREKIYIVNKNYSSPTYNIPTLLNDISKVKHYDKFGYDTSTYLENIELLKKEISNIHNKIIDDFRNTNYDKNFHQQLKEYTKKIEYNKKFLEKIKNDKISPNGEKHPKPSSTFMDWMEETWYRIKSYEDYYTSYKKFTIDEINKLNKINNDYHNEKERTENHISQVKKRDQSNKKTNKNKNKNIQK